MPKLTYDLRLPNTLTSSVVFASPHSGRDYSDEFQNASILDPLTLRSSEDAYVDKLFEASVLFGAPFLRAGAPRAFVDLNRNYDELDPALIEGVTRRALNPRIASGLGVIPRVVSMGREIYRGKLSLAEANRRIENYWHPYHHQLTKLIDTAHTQFGRAILIDCHSMPREALENVGRVGARRPDVVIGDRYGASASAHIVEQIEAIFRAAGFAVARNTPFAGAYIAQHYGRPSMGRHAIQIELDRSLYLDETTILPNAEFEDVLHRLRPVISSLAAIGRSDQALAAE